MGTRGPVETKVWAAGGGISAGAVLAVLIEWGLGVTVFGQPFTAAAAEAAVNAVPRPLAEAIFTAISIASGVLAAYLAPHTNRPDLADPQGVEVKP